jgi:hypothetical protein
VVAVGRGQHHPGPTHAPEDIDRSGHDAHPPPSPVTLGISYLNRGHTMTGKAATPSKSKLVLSQWAQAYEERHGRVFCAARVENNAKRSGTMPGRASDTRTRRATRPEQR